MLQLPENGHCPWPKLCKFLQNLPLAKVEMERKAAYKLLLSGSAEILPNKSSGGIFASRIFLHWLSDALVGCEHAVAFIPSPSLFLSFDMFLDQPQGLPVLFCLYCAPPHALLTLEQITNQSGVLHRDNHSSRQTQAHMLHTDCPKHSPLACLRKMPPQREDTFYLKPKNILFPWIRRRRLVILGSLINGKKHIPRREGQQATDFPLCLSPSQAHKSNPKNVVQMLKHFM